MCLINVLKCVKLFFSFASHEFWGTSTAFPSNTKFTISLLSHSPLLIYFLITHIKSMKDIRSITVRFMLRHLRMSSNLKF